MHSKPWSGENDLPCCIRWQTSIQYCMCLTENSPLTLNRYVTDCPIKKNSSYLHKNCKSTNKSTSEASALCYNCPSLKRPIFLISATTDPAQAETKTITSQDVPPVTARIAASTQQSTISSCCCTSDKCYKAFYNSHREKGQTSTMPHLTQIVLMEVSKFSLKIILAL